MNIAVGVASVAAINNIIMFEMFADDDDPPDRIEKVWNFAEEIVHRMDHKQFQYHFRLHVETFENLLAKCYTVVNETHSLVCGNQGLTVEKDLLILIWYLANLECFRSVANRFGVSKSTSWQSFYRMCNIILHVSTRYKVISWPENNRRDLVKEGFFSKASMQNVVGAIDGSHVPISAPSDSPHSYVNRKGFHSVLLQAVCDSEMVFIDCYAGEAGSLHDAALFRRSDLHNRLPNIIGPDEYLVGDSAYPLSKAVMVPFKAYQPLGRMELCYNVAHSRTRVVIERAFALLKGRFRRLKLLETVRFDCISVIIICGCILHICLLNGDDLNDQLNMDNELEEERRMNGNEGVINDGHAAAGITRRNAIARYLYNLSRHRNATVQ